ncbi:hypothetical protein D9M72_416640 [compost metagenome]
MPQAVAAGHQQVARLQLGDVVRIDGRRRGRHAQATQQDVALRMDVGLGLADLAAIDQRLHVRMVARALDQRAVVEVIDARVACVDPGAVAFRVHQEGGQRAVRLLLARQRRELDHRVGVFEQLAQHDGGVVALGAVAGEELARGHEHLVGRLAPAAAPAHAVGDDAEHAARRAGVAHQQHLVLLVGAIPLVEAGGGGESKALGHERWGARGALSVFSGVRVRTYYRMNTRGPMRHAHPHRWTPIFIPFPVS